MPRVLPPSPSRAAGRVAHGSAGARRGRSTGNPRSRSPVQPSLRRGGTDAAAGGRNGGDAGRYQRMPSTRLVARLAPGSGRLVSARFMFYWFSFHAQVVLRVQARRMRGFQGYDPRPARIHSTLYLAAWLALGVAVGPRASRRGSGAGCARTWARATCRPPICAPSWRSTGRLPGWCAAWRGAPAAGSRPEARAPTRESCLSSGGPVPHDPCRGAQGGAAAGR